MKTKFGNAELWGNGYYYITSTAEGNFKQLLHRLIFEDFYGPIPEGCVIHHKDGNKTNNCIMNLQLLTESEHHRQHSVGENNPFYGRKHSEETKRKIGEKSKGRMFKDYPRIIKAGSANGIKMYGLVHNKKVIRRSKYKERLEPYLDELLKEGCYDQNN